MTNEWLPIAQFRQTCRYDENNNSKLVLFYATGYVLGHHMRDIDVFVDTNYEQILPTHFMLLPHKPIVH
jgi:hypothetical protein